MLALRADYVAAAAEHTELAALMADCTLLVGSPTPAEIERAITRPAARAGLALEDGLAETMVDEAGNEPGLLPLLSVALTQVWEQRTDERLTYAGTSPSAASPAPSAPSPRPSGRSSRPRSSRLPGCSC